MRVFVTGGAGFLGSHLADRLLAQGHYVTAFDNFVTGSPRNLSPNEKLTVVEGTVAERATVRSVVDQAAPDVVVHAAASYRDPDDWFQDSMTNVAGTANVVQESKRKGVQRIVYLQTALCYGVKPLENPITLLHPLNPGASSYAVTKTAGEQFVLLSGLNAVSLRLANIYGPRNISGPLPTFYQRLTTGKSCFVADTRRDFVFVDDLIDLVMEVISGKGRPGIYHVSSGTDHAIKEIFDATVTSLGIKLDKEVEVRPRGPDDAYSILLDPSKTRQEFGWRTKTMLSAGIHKTVSWYKQFGVAATYTHLKPPAGPRY